MPFIQVTLLEGRTKDKKEKLCRDLTKATSENLGIAEDQVKIALYEISPDNWADGGTLRSNLKK